MLEDKPRKKIFVCSPYGGKEKNLTKAKAICRALLQDKKNGGIPFAPHVFFTQFLNESDPLERSAGIDAGLAVMEFHDEVWMFVHDGITAGMMIEEAHAIKIGKPVKYVDWDI